MEAVACAVLAGGAGSRLGGPWKPLLAPCGVPMVEAVARALAGSGACRAIAAVTSPASDPAVRPVLEPLGVEVIVGGGRLEADVEAAITLLGAPLLVAPADVPLLDGRLAARLARLALHASRGVAVVDVWGPRGPTGVSLYARPGGPWRVVRLEDPRLVDVDTWEDAWEVARACGRGGTAATPRRAWWT